MLVVLLLGWLVVCQSDSIVIHTSPATEVGGRAVIKVVAVKHGWGIRERITSFPPRFYRCEYFLGADVPMWSSQSLGLQSQTLQRIAVRWHNRDEASVYFDGMLVFHCRQGVWSPAR